jgi:hypothetical protein
MVISTVSSESVHFSVTGDANNYGSFPITILDDTNSTSIPNESVPLSRCQQVTNWFSESGDPAELRPPRWKRFTLLAATCTTAVASRVLTTDSIITNSASLLSAVQVNAEIYDWNGRNKFLFLITIIALTTLGEQVLFPESSFIREAALSGLCWALAIRTFSVESQKWINIKAAQNK